MFRRYSFTSRALSYRHIMTASTDQFSLPSLGDKLDPMVFPPGTAEAKKRSPFSKHIITLPHSDHGLQSLFSTRPRRTHDDLVRSIPLLTSSKSSSPTHTIPASNAPRVQQSKFLPSARRNFPAVYTKNKRMQKARIRIKNINQKKKSHLAVLERKIAERKAEKESGITPKKKRMKKSDGNKSGERSGMSKKR